MQLAKSEWKVLDMLPHKMESLAEKVHSQDGPRYVFLVVHEHSHQCIDQIQGFDCSLDFFIIGLLGFRVTAFSALLFVTLSAFLVFFCC